MNQDNINDDFYENNSKYLKRKQLQEKEAAKIARERIRNKAIISINTCAIGSLSSFEKHLGKMWRHGEDYNNLTPQEKRFRDLWLDARDEILNRAENSKRLLLQEINRCEFKGYKQDKYTTILRNRDNYDE